MCLAPRYTTPCAPTARASSSACWSQGPRVSRGRGGGAQGLLAGSWERLPEARWGRARRLIWLRVSALVGDAISRRHWETGFEGLNGSREGTAACVAGPLRIASHPILSVSPRAALLAYHVSRGRPGPSGTALASAFMSVRRPLHGPVLLGRWHLTGYPLTPPSRRDRGV